MAKKKLTAQQWITQAIEAGMEPLLCYWLNGKRGLLTNFCDIELQNGRSCDLKSDRAGLTFKRSQEVLTAPPEISSQQQLTRSYCHD